MLKKLSLLILIVVFSLFSTLAIAQDDEHSEEESHGSAPHWGYEGDVGPEHWGDLSEDFALCGSGVAQSPINIDDAMAIEAGLVDIDFNYGETALNILNNGHTIQVNVDAGSSITYNGITYNLLQFHFHAPSEHQWNSEHAAMEVHFVHQDANSGNLAVVGVLLNIGDSDNAGFADVFSNLPAEVTEPMESDIMVDLNALLPEGAKFYTYQGSLTTPPCSEIVRWLVQDTDVKVGADQVSAYTAIYDGNNRPVLDLGARDLLHDNN